MDRSRTNHRRAGTTNSRGQRARNLVCSLRRPLLLPYDIAAEALPWPAPATTDEQGRFAMRGLGRNAGIELEAISNRHAPQTFEIDPGNDETTSQRTITLSPAQVIEVHVTGAGDGRPQAGAWVSVISDSSSEGGWGWTKKLGARTNEQGLARIIPPTGYAFGITAGPPAGARLSHPACGLQLAERSCSALGGTEARARGASTRRDHRGSIRSTGRRCFRRILADAPQQPPLSKSPGGIKRSSVRARGQVPDRRSRRPGPPLGPRGDPRLSPPNHHVPGARRRRSVQPVFVPGCARSH